MSGPLHPGTYVEEVSGSVPPIAGVATSVAAFIGSFSNGPVNDARQILSAAEFEREYGGPRADTPTASAIRQFFLNGGQQAWVVRTTSRDGAVPGAQDLVDTLPALDGVDLVNLLCIPDTDRLAAADAARVISAATAYAAGRGLFYIIDKPTLEAPLNGTAGTAAWLRDNASLRHRNAAAYFPRPLVADARSTPGLRPVPTSGTIAGLYARFDGERGVWKAPAGLAATLRGVQRLEYVMTDAENGELNSLGMNCLRTFRATGSVCWGARTLVGADALASEWKYVPVRRLALFLEASLSRGLQFAVFEPNAEPLWSRIRLSIGSFMQALFQRGALQGRTSDQAYFVRCDRETTTQEDIARGMVNIVVGFAPQRPAEFVVIRISQLAGRTQS